MTAPPRRALLIGGAIAGVAAAAAGLGLALRGSKTEGQLPVLDEPRSSAPASGADLWSMRFERPSGGELIMAELRGKPLLVNFWATWCAPCVAEMPMLDQFQRDHAAKGWRVVGLAVDNADPVRDFVKRRNVEFAVGILGFAGSELARDLGNSAGALPFSVVFGRDGKPQQRKLGALKPEDLANWVKAVG